MFCGSYRENNKFTRGVDKLIENYTPFESAGKFFDGVNRFTLVSKLLAYNVRFGTASFLQPYQMVKDLRNKTENTNPESVLNGNIDQFIEEGLKNK